MGLSTDAGAHNKEDNGEHKSAEVADPGGHPAEPNWEERVRHTPGDISAVLKLKIRTTLTRAA